MRRKPFSYIMFLVLGLYIAGGSLVPEEYRDYLFIALVVIIPTFGRLVKNNARKQSNEHKNNDSAFNNFFNQESEPVQAQNLVECPYCSHMNPDHLTFCEKCNGLL